LQGASPEENALTLYKIIAGRLPENDSKVEVVLANSAVGLIVGGKTDDFRSGMELARESIYSGAAYKKLKALIQASGGSLGKLEEFEQHE